MAHDSLGTTAAYAMLHNHNRSMRNRNRSLHNAQLHCTTRHSTASTQAAALNQTKRPPQSGIGRMGHATSCIRPSPHPASGGFPPPYHCRWPGPGQPHDPPWPGGTQNALPGACPCNGAGIDMIRSFLTAEADSSIKAMYAGASSSDAVGGRVSMINGSHTINPAMHKHDTRVL